MTQRLLSGVEAKARLKKIQEGQYTRCRTENLGSKRLLSGVEAKARLKKIQEDSTQDAGQRI